MDKHIQEALWIAMGQAYQERDLEKIAAYVAHLQGQRPPQPANQPKVSCKTAYVFEAIAKDGRFDAFLDDIKAQGRDTFSTKEVREWMAATGINKEIEEGLPTWENYVGSSLAAFYKKSSPHYKGIALSDTRGRYKIVEDNPPSQLNGQASAAFSGGDVTNYPLSAFLG